LEKRSHFLPRPAWMVILLFYASCHHWDDRGTTPHPAFFPPMRSGKQASMAELAWSYDPPDSSLPSS
jgi:hypothetical protein